MKINPTLRRISRLLLASFCLGPSVPAGLAAGESPGEAPPPSVRWLPRLPDTDANNLVPNSGFELGGAGWSSLGKQTGWGGNLSSLFGTISTAEKYEGERSLEVALGPGKTLVTHYDGWPAATVAQNAPLAVNLGWITVVPGETYTLSAYFKADRPGVPARLVMRFGGDPAPDPKPVNEEKAITLSDKWERYAFTFKATSVSVCIGVGPDLSKTPDAAARVWIDAVQFEKKPQASGYAPRAAIEVALESGHFGNVYPADAPANLRVTTVNRTGQAAEFDLTIQLSDYFDQLLPEKHHHLSAPAGRIQTEEVPLALPGPGFYRTRIVAAGKDFRQETRFPMAVINEYKRPDTLFGLNHAPANPDLLDHYRRAGIFWAREWSLDWQEVQPKPGPFDFAEADRQVGRLEKAGWKIHALLPAFSSAMWASAMPPDYQLPPGKWRATPSWAWLAAAPKDPANLDKYIRATAGHYKGRIGTYEFLNEPTTSTALPAPYRAMPGFGYDAQAYVDLLKVASKALRETDPTAKVMGGYSLEILHRAPHFIRAGGLDLIDIFNIHPYGFFEEAPEDFIPQMQELLALMDAWPTGRKPIWVTEVGYYGEDDKPRELWVKPDAPFGLDSEKQAADQAVRHALIMLAHGVEKIFYHSGHSGSVNDGMGDLNTLLGPLGTPQKSYPAIAFLASLLGPDFKYVGPMAKPAQLNGLPTDSIYGYAFQSGNKAVLAAWAPAEWQHDHVWSLKVPRDVHAYNIVGTQLHEGGNGKSVVLGDSPVYFVTELMTAGDLARAQMLRVGKKPQTNPPASFMMF